MTSHNWVFTKQLSDAEVDQLEHTTNHPFHFEDGPNVRYCVYQEEIAPSTGKHHLQGFISVKKACRLAAIKKILGEAHIEIAHDVQASITYCKKSETRHHGPWEFGEIPQSHQGQRTDLDGLWQAVKEKKRAKELLEEDPKVARFEKAIKFMKFTHTEDQSDRTDAPLNVIVNWGPTGTGKTWSAIKNTANNKDYYILDMPPSKTSAIWFDGYDGQDTLIIDDFDDHLIPISFLKRLLDNYKLKLPIKGAFAWATYHTVVITTQWQPDKWYLGEPERDRDAIFRRLKRIFNFPDQSEHTSVETDIHGSSAPPPTFVDDLQFSPHSPNPFQ